MSYISDTVTANYILSFPEQLLHTITNNQNMPRKELNQFWVLANEAINTITKKKNNKYDEKMTYLVNK